VDYSALAGGKSQSGSLKYWVNHSILPVDDILTDAQGEIYARLRSREMRASTDINVAIGDFATALPGDFLDPISFKDQYKCDIALRDPGVLEDMRGFDSAGALLKGPISDYAIYDEKLQYDMASNAAATFKLVYFKRPALLSVSNNTNFLTTRYPNLLRAAALKHAYAFRKAWDESTRHAQALEAYLQTIEINDDLSNRGIDSP
jgi:hypothetical protein